MKRHAGLLPLGPLTAFPSSAWLGVLAGGLSLALPFFVGLALALGSLAITAWLTDGARCRLSEQGRALGLVGVAVGIVGALMAPPAADPWRGPIIAFGLLSLLGWDRSHATRSGSST